MTVLAATPRATDVVSGGAELCAKGRSAIVFAVWLEDVLSSAPR
jgi:hypothetical protein